MLPLLNSMQKDACHALWSSSLLRRGCLFHM